MDGVVFLVVENKCCSGGVTGGVGGGDGDNSGGEGGDVTIMVTRWCVVTINVRIGWPMIMMV